MTQSDDDTVVANCSAESESGRAVAMTHGDDSSPSRTHRKSSLQGFIEDLGHTVADLILT